VTNILASIVGTPATTVEKTATAAFVTIGGATPELPIAIGSCYFEGLCAGCLPDLIQVPSSSQGEANNTAWTAFFETANAMTIADYFPSPCGAGVAVPHVDVGDNINITNGQISNLYDNFQCLLDNGVNEFVIPVFQSESSTCNGPMVGSPEVIGFVTLVVDAVNGMGNPKYVDLHAIENATVPGTPGGCAGCLTGSVKLIN
jgi:hypothetical protein